MRKKLIQETTVQNALASGEIDLATSAVLAYSSEDPAHPVDHLLDRSSGPGSSRWLSARPDTIEHLVIEFDKPQSISRLIYEAVETERPRTQEVRVEASADGGDTYRQVLVQEYTFSPEGANFQREDLRLDLKNVSHLRLIIVPNKNGSGTATLSSLRIFS